eukprot:55149-Chlamydomonas_euryale.AAC.1
MASSTGSSIPPRMESRSRRMDRARRRARLRLRRVRSAFHAGFRWAETGAWLGEGSRRRRWRNAGGAGDSAAAQRSAPCERSEQTAVLAGLGALAWGAVHVHLACMLGCLAALAWMRLRRLCSCYREELLSCYMPPSPPVPRLVGLQAPTASEIRSAIVEEARRRGIEDQLVHDTPSLPRAPLTAPHDLMDMDNQLMGLIEALEGRLGQLRNAGGSGAASGGSGGDAVADAATLTGAGATPAAPAATGLAEPEDLEQMITPPEPEAELLSQLTDMGFSNALARKALMLHRNRVPEAVEWVLVHAEDADAEEPVTQEQLRRIYGPARRRGGGAP